MSKLDDAFSAVSPSQLVVVSPDRMGGVPVFAGTRVPVKAMFDYLEAGDSVDRFVEHFPDVTREHALAVLRSAQSAYMQDLAPAA